MRGEGERVCRDRTYRGEEDLAQSSPIRLGKKEVAREREERAKKSGLKEEEEEARQRQKHPPLMGSVSTKRALVGLSQAAYFSSIRLGCLP